MSFFIFSLFFYLGGDGKCCGKIYQAYRLVAFPNL
jgi:hypothetical protein